MITYTPAIYEHISGISALQEQNLAANIPPEAHSNGFVTTPFTVEQLQHLIDERGMFIALQDEQVVGYAVSASWDYLSQWPIFPHMVSLFPEFTYHDTRMTTENSYQYGPVCVSHALRGGEVFPALFNYARQQMHSRYSYGLTFINKRNHRSYAAHTRKVKIDVIREFAFNGQEYYFLGFLT